MGAFLKAATHEGIPATQLVFFRAIFQGFFVIIGMLCYKEEPVVNKEQEVRLDTTSDHFDWTIDDDDSDDSHDGEYGTVRQESFQEYDPTRQPKRLICIPLGRKGEQRNVVILRGVVGGAFGFICYFYSIKSLPLGDAITVFSIYPVYTIFMAKFFLNESITCRHIIITILNLIGGAFIAGPSFLSFRNGDDVDAHGEQYNPLGYITALVGGFFAAAVVILIKKAGTSVHTLQLLFSWCCFGFIASIGFGFTIGKVVEGDWVVPQSNTTWGYILGTCAVGTMAHALLNYAGRFVPAGLCALIRSTDILWAYILEIVVFHEVPSSTTILGVALVIISLVMIALEKIRDEKIGKKYNLLSRDAELYTREFENEDTSEVEML